MFREKEQISDIVIATKVALKTKNKIDYLPFEYEKNIEFLFTKNKVFFFERSYKAKTIEEWYKYCLKLGLEDIQILLPVSSVNSNIPNELNTNKNKFICYFKNNLVLYFTPKWDETSGGWNIIYTAHKYENSTNKKIKFYDMEKIISFKILQKPFNNSSNYDKNRNNILSYKIMDYIQFCFEDFINVNINDIEVFNIKLNFEKYRTEFLAIPIDECKNIFLLSFWAKSY